MKDSTIQKKITLVAGLSGALAILLGAYSAHGLENYLASTGISTETQTRRLAQFETGVRYHLFHSVVLLCLAALPFGKDRAKRKASWLFVLGLLLFSGSLYLLVFLNLPILGAITPLGGLSWIAGWIYLSTFGMKTKE